MWPLSIAVYDPKYHGVAWDLQLCPSNPHSEYSGLPGQALAQAPGSPGTGHDVSPSGRATGGISRETQTKSSDSACHKPQKANRLSPHTKILLCLALLGPSNSESVASYTCFWCTFSGSWREASLSLAPWQSVVQDRASFQSTPGELWGPDAPLTIPMLIRQAGSGLGCMGQSQSVPRARAPPGECQAPPWAVLTLRVYIDTRGSRRGAHGYSSFNIIIWINKHSGEE